MKNSKIKFFNKEIPILYLLKTLKIIPKEFDSDRMECFFCEENQRESISFFKNKNKFRCFRCKETYDVVAAFMKCENITDYKVAFSELTKIHEEMKKNLIPENSSFSSSNKKNQNIQSTPKEEKWPKWNYPKQVFPIFKEVSLFYHNQLLENSTALEYLKKTRKLTSETIEEFQLGFSTKPDENYYCFNLVNYFKQKKHKLDDMVRLNLIKKNQEKNFFYDYFNNRFVIPIRMEYLNQMEVAHFYGNNPNSEKNKYFAQPLFSKYTPFNYMFNFHKALKHIDSTKTLLIHEGFFDVITTFQHGIKNVCGVININQKLTKFQLKILKQNEVKCVIILDKDEAGMEASIRLSTQLKENNIPNEIRYIPTEPKCKDVDDLIKKHGISEYKKLIA